jgi:hypothetical protein
MRCNLTKLTLTIPKDKIKQETSTQEKVSSERERALDETVLKSRRKESRKSVIGQEGSCDDDRRDRNDLRHSDNTRERAGPQMS